MKCFTIDNDNDIRVHASSQEADAVANAERFSTAAGLTKLAEKWPATRLVEVWNSLPGVSPVKKFTDRNTAATRIWRAIQSLGGSAQETEVPAEVAVVEPVAQPQPEPARESVAPPASSEPSIPATEHASQTHEPSVAPVETAQQTTPFDDESGAEPQGSSESAAGQPESAPELETQQDAAATPTTEPEVVANVGAPSADVAPSAAKATKKASRAKNAPKAETGAPREGSKTSRVIEMLKREGGTTLEEIMAEMGWLKHTTRAMLSAGGSLTKKHGLVVVSEKVGDTRTYRINQ